MKKILKKEVIIAFIIGSILTSSITVYALTSAKDIEYTRTGITNVEEALNDLYQKQQNNYNEWVEVQDGLTGKSSCFESAKLYKCGNLCKISFAIDNININTEYSLITNSKYFPKEEFEVYGYGVDKGMANVKFKTNGNIVVTSQSLRNGSGWSAVKNIVYICAE